MNQRLHFSFLLSFPFVIKIRPICNLQKDTSNNATDLDDDDDDDDDYDTATNNNKNFHVLHTV